MGPLTARQQEAFNDGYDYGRFSGYPPSTTNLKNYYGKNYIYGLEGSRVGLIERKEAFLLALLEGK